MTFINDTTDTIDDEELAAALALKSDKSETYTKSQVNDNFQPTGDYALSSSVALKADQSSVDTSLALKADQSAVRPRPRNSNVVHGSRSRVFPSLLPLSLPPPPRRSRVRVNYDLFDLFGRASRDLSRLTIS